MHREPGSCISEARLDCQGGLEADRIVHISDQSLHRLLLGHKLIAGKECGEHMQCRKPTEQESGRTPELYGAHNRRILLLHVEYLVRCSVTVNHRLTC